jgi:hypothetical protein
MRDASFADGREAGLPRVALNAGDDRPRPFRRFCAKSADIAVASLLTMTVFTAFGTGLGLGPGRDSLSALALSLGSLLAWAGLEVFLLASFGTTLGRLLFRLAIKQENGAALTFDHIVWRTLRVLVYGFGLGIPIVTLITQIIAYLRLTGSGRTSWDRKGGLRAIHGPMSLMRWIGALAATLAIILAAMRIGI